MPVIVSEYAPGAAAVVVDIERVELVVAGLGEKTPEVPEGRPLRPRLTMLANPFSELIFIV